MNIQWYPGHMAKTRRQIIESLSLCDLVAEIVDARIPKSSRNPDIDSLAKGKPRLIILNHRDQADPECTKCWLQYFRSLGYTAIDTECKNGGGCAAFLPAVRLALKEKLERLSEKGQAGRTVKIMVVGVPNVGKSSFINRIAGRKSAKTADRPGVTRGKQWIRLDKGLDLLDTPGMLWPKLDDEETGHNLAFTGAIKDDIIDTEELAALLLETLARLGGASLEKRYGLDAAQITSGSNALSVAAKNRGFLLPGGVPDTERMSHILLDEYRSGKLGRISLELPPEA